MWKQVEKILEERVRPQLALHNGGVELLSIEDDTVHIRLLGQCSNCPASYLTTEQFILGELASTIPGVQRVFVDHSVSEDLLEQARALLRKNHEES